jgi:ABC-2 type transport system permease protein
MIVLCLSMTTAGLVISRDRPTGPGQAITMPLFFGSPALYPVPVMPVGRGPSAR